MGTGPSEVDRVGADPAADLEHPLAPPALELGEAGNVRLDEVLPRLDLVEVLAEPTGFGEWRMLQGRASQYCWTSSTDFVGVLVIRT